MKKHFTILPRWIPALFVMVVIFLFSSQPSQNLPDFDVLDKIVKKGGHAIGYGLLTLSYLYALREHKYRSWLAWGLAILYAMSDEFHQSFVPGRSPSIWDVIIFDNLGALFALFLYSRSSKNR